MRFNVLSVGFLSMPKEFNLIKIEAEDIDEALKIVEESSDNFTSDWVLTDEELNRLRECLK